MYHNVKKMYDEVYSDPQNFLVVDEVGTERQFSDSDIKSQTKFVKEKARYVYGLT